MHSFGCLLEPLGNQLDPCRANTSWDLCNVTERYLRMHKTVSAGTFIESQRYAEMPRETPREALRAVRETPRDVQRTCRDVQRAFRMLRRTIVDASGRAQEQRDAKIDAKKRSEMRSTIPRGTPRTLRDALRDNQRSAQRQQEQLYCCETKQILNALVLCWFCSVLHDVKAARTRPSRQDFCQGNLTWALQA